MGSEGLVQLGGPIFNMLEILVLTQNNAKFTVIVFMIYLTEAEYMVEATWKCIEILLLFIEIKENFHLSMNDCYNTIKLLHAFYLSDEKSNWVNLNDEIVSLKLGRENDEISNLFRFHFLIIYTNI